jgi:hypothetical protein
MASKKCSTNSIEQNLFSIGIMTSLSPGNECYSYFDEARPSTLLSAISDLESYLEDQGPFDGVLGFSQGASLAATFMVKEATQNRVTPSFRCAFLFSCPGALDFARNRLLDASTDEGVICVPTAHIFGSNDKFRDASWNVSQVCNRQTREVFEHSGDHEIPRNPVAVADKSTPLVVGTPL